MKSKIFGIFCVLTLMLAGCSASAETGSNEIASELTEPVTIEVWHPFTGDVEASLTTLTEEFNNSQDMVTVNLTYQGGYNDLYSKLQAAKSTSTLPTVSFAYSSWEDIRDVATDLSGFEGAGDTTLEFSNFVDAYISEVTAEDGAIYGIPYNKSTEVVFYNKDLAEQASITQIPQTFEELFNDAKAITDVTQVAGIGFDSLSNYLANAMNTCQIVNWQDDAGNFIFNDECVEATVQLYQDGVNAGYARTAGEDGYLSGPFGSGSVAAFVGSTAGASYIESGVNGAFEWGAFAVPSDVVVQQGTNLVIYNTATPEEKLAAWEYIDFLMSDENIVNFAKTTGYLPVTTSAIESADYQAYLETNEVAKAAYDSIEKMEVAVPFFSGANEIYSSNFTSIMSGILDGGEDIDTALTELNEQAKAVYDRNNG